MWAIREVRGISITMVLLFGVMNQAKQSTELHVGRKRSRNRSSFKVKWFQEGEIELRDEAKMGLTGLCRGEWPRRGGLT